MSKELEKARQFSLDHWVSISGVILNPTEAHEVLTRLLNQFAEASVREVLEECCGIVRDFKYFMDGPEDQIKSYIQRAIRTRFAEELNPDER